jgi:hypothetical protein
MLKTPKAAFRKSCLFRGVARERASLRGSKVGTHVNTLNEKKVIFCTQNFQIIEKYTQNSINNCDLVLKYVISVTRHHFDYSPLAQKKRKLTTPLRLCAMT